MNDALGFGTALLLGLLASGHCLAMCGGISGALAFAVPRDARGRAPLPVLLGFQFGRVGSYALIGVLFGGLGAGLIRLLDLDAVRLGLRALTAFTLLLIAASLLGWLCFYRNWPVYILFLIRRQFFRAILRVIYINRYLRQSSNRFLNQL